MALDTDRIRQLAIAISIWLSGAHASLAEDFSGGCRSGSVSDESNSGAAYASDGVRVLRLSRNAINGRFCDAFTRHATGLLYFLSFISERLSASLFVALAFMFAYLD